nr:MAG TPA: hypothetical protein [Caudoviricetes sp.]
MHIKNLCGIMYSTSSTRRRYEEASRQRLPL